MENELLRSGLVIVATLLTVIVVRWGLRRLAKLRHLSALADLAPPLSNITYILGMKFFIESAPLNPRLAVWLENIVFVFGILIVLGLIRRSAWIFIDWLTGRARYSPTFQQGFVPLLQNLTTLLVFFIGGIMILKHFNYDVMSLVTALGVGSLAVGLAAKETLSNMISGFTLIIDRNLIPGDRVGLGNFMGEVESIGLRSTRIRLEGGSTLIVPNAEIVNSKLLNFSQPSRAIACSTVVRFALDISFEKIKILALAALDEVDKADRSRARSVVLSGLVDGAQVVTVSFWVTHSGDASQAVSQLNEKLLVRCLSEKITPGIPATMP